MPLGPLWHRYELLDWLLLCALGVYGLYMQSVPAPYCRPFQWDDPTLSYPDLPNTFPDYSLFVMVLGAVAFYAVFVRWLVRPLQWLCGAPPSPTPGPLYPWIKAHLWASMLQDAIATSLKIYTGRPRPDFLARLTRAGIVADKRHDPQTDFLYYCRLTQTRDWLRDGRMAFPSGHASTSFAVFTLLSLFLAAYLRPGARQGSFARLLVALSPMTVAFVCAASRSRDYKHAFADIVAGALIGVGCALLCFCVCFRRADAVAGGWQARRAEDGEAEAERTRRYGEAGLRGYDALTTAVPMLPREAAETTTLPVGGAAAAATAAVAAKEAAVVPWI